VNCFTLANGKIDGIAGHFIKGSQSAGNIALQKYCHLTLETR
jgi:hypothetical protein